MKEPTVRSMAIALAETWERRAESWDELKRAAPGITSFAGIYREMAGDIRRLLQRDAGEPQPR